MEERTIEVDESNDRLLVRFAYDKQMNQHLLNLGASWSTSLGAWVLHGIEKHDDDAEDLHTNEGFEIV